MLQQLTMPLMHHGYRLPQVARAGPDWQYQHMSAAEANDHLGKQVERIHAHNAALYGGDNLPPARTCPDILRVVCLLAADWDAMKVTFAAPDVAMLATAPASHSGSGVAVGVAVALCISTKARALFVLGLNCYSDGAKQQQQGGLLGGLDVTVVSCIRPYPVFWPQL